MNLSNNLPNKLTILRILLTPIFVLIVLSNVIAAEYRDITSAFFFLAIAFTDFFDGFIARRNNMITNFGINIDPIADKILIMSAMGMLVFLERLNPCIFIFLIGRDFIMCGVRIIAAEKNADISAIRLGRIKTVLEVILITILLLNWNFPFSREVLLILITIIIITAMVSCIQYIIAYWPVIKTSWNEYKPRNLSKKDEKGVEGDDK